MKRADIEAEYKVVNGIIRSPGKFEGEPVWSPYFYALVMDGEGDIVSLEGSDTAFTATLDIQPEDVAGFPDLEGWKSVHIRVRDDGFVEATVCT